MRFAIGFLAGAGAVWAALAIWQRVPPLGPVDAVDEKLWPPPPEVDVEAYVRGWRPPHQDYTLLPQIEHHTTLCHRMFGGRCNCQGVQ